MSAQISSVVRENDSAATLDCTYGMRLTILLVLVLLFVGCRPSAAPHHDLPKLSGPLSIKLSTKGAFVEGDSWTLSVDEAGKAKLLIDSAPNISRTFDVTQSQLDELRTLLLSERFFDLASDYGEIVPDSSTCTITIRNADIIKTVHVHFLMNWVNPNDISKLTEPARALRVILCIRKWFNDPQAIDHSESDVAVLQAVPRS